LTEADAVNVSNLFRALGPKASTRFRWSDVALLLILSGLCLLARMEKCAEVFSPRGVTYVDPDCYTRMARVERLAENPLHPLRQHDFENYPIGIRAHTTSLMDYLILGLAAAFRPFASNAMDLAGAWASPALGLALLFFLWWWCGLYLGQTARFFALAAYAILPTLAWGQNVGRPDHQSLILLLVTVGIALEVCLIRWPASRPIQVAGGLAWGLALWTSLFEPVVILAATLLIQFAFDWRGTLLRRNAWWLALAATCGLGLAIDGWARPAIDPETLPYLRRWLAEIGELAGTGPRRFTFWFGGWIWALPVTLFLACRTLKLQRRPLVLLASLTILLTALTFWHIRWGALLGAACCLFAIPLLMSLPGRFWQPVVWFFLSVPVFVYYVHALDVSAAASPYRDSDLRLVAKSIRGQGGILAPWWISPPLLYFSGEPIVASSSHESIAGNIDAARFFLEPDWRKCREILDRRKVRWIVTDHPGRVLSQAIRLLGLGRHTEAEAVRIRDLENTLAARLHGARAVPPLLKLRAAAGDFFLYEYVPE
jgi:hypothetical protein